MRRVFIDAGHGGKDSGALGNRLKEKDINLTISLKIGEILEKNGIGVIYSRTKDVFLELYERTQKANKANADVFVSIHCNSASSSNARGVEIFYYSRQNSSKLAKLVQNNLFDTKLYSSNRGVKTADFYVLRETNMPSCLIELGFINNIEDSRILINKQNQLSKAIAQGIIEYLTVIFVDDIQKVKININGKVKEVDAINKDGNNYVKLQDLRDDKIIIDYDKEKKIPILRV